MSIIKIELKSEMHELVTYIIIVGGIILALFIVFMLKILLKEWIIVQDERKLQKSKGMEISNVLSFKRNLRKT